MRWWWYYRMRPLIPRGLQLGMRQLLAAHIRRQKADLWPIDPAAAAPPAGPWGGWPDAKQFAVVLVHDVEWESGLHKCLPLAELERQRGMCSAFFFVPERYAVSDGLRQRLAAAGCEVGVHGLRHDGLLYSSRKTFFERAVRINYYLRQWQCSGFRSPSSQRNFDWISHLDICYDSSSFDTDPFEPEPEGVGTIFPFVLPRPVVRPLSRQPLVELPYTMPQDSTLYLVLQEPDNRIWREKLDWIAANGGMVFLNTHPDYMSMPRQPRGFYPWRWYGELLDYLQTVYAGKFWNPLPREMASFWSQYHWQWSGNAPAPELSPSDP